VALTALVGMLGGVALLFGGWRGLTGWLTSHSVGPHLHASVRRPSLSSHHPREMRSSWHPGRRVGNPKSEEAELIASVVARETPARAWRMLAILSMAELLGMSMWFSAIAVSPYFRSAWGLTV